MKLKPNLPVNGLQDKKGISDLFADYFETTCSPNSPAAENKLKVVFEEKLNDYIGNILTTKNLFDVEQITKLITFMKLGKSPGIDGITLEHLIHSHYYVFVMITFLCNLMTISGYVPNEFGCGLTYPIPKTPTYKKLLTTSDFRGITLNPIVSKIMEKGILENFESYFHTSDSQFGFKRKLNCSHALFSVRTTVDYYTSNDSDVIICLLDISKAFDKVNRYALFTKLIDRKVPANIIQLLFIWYRNSS